MTASTSIEYVEPSDINAGIVALRLLGKITVDDLARALVRMEEALERTGRLRLFFDISAYDGLEFAALWEKLKRGGPLLSGLERVAVVGDQRWAEWWSRVVDPLTPFVIRHFDGDERDDAARWITG